MTVSGETATRDSAALSDVTAMMVMSDLDWTLGGRLAGGFQNGDVQNSVATNGAGGKRRALRRRYI